MSDSFYVFSGFDHELAEKFCSWLDSKIDLAPTTLRVYINSYGGDCAALWSMLDSMQSSPHTIATIGTGAIMSCGHMLFIAGDMRILFEGCECMAHQFSSGQYGKYHELESNSSNNKKFFDKQVKHYERNGSLSSTQVKNKILKETDCFITASDMLKYGYADQVIKPTRRTKIVRNSNGKKK